MGEALNQKVEAEKDAAHRSIQAAVWKRCDITWTGLVNGNYHATLDQDPEPNLKLEGNLSSADGLRQQFDSFLSG